LIALLRNGLPRYLLQLNSNGPRNPEKSGCLFARAEQSDVFPRDLLE